MKGKFSILLVGLSVMALLVAASNTQVMQTVTAQGNEVVVNEVEPNDSKEEAQLITLTPGTTTVVRGHAARGDRSSFVEELELLFTLGDPMEDWFAFDVNGIAELEIELSWATSSDMDSWIMGDISDFVYTDALAELNVAASLANPERYGNKLYYTYSNREDEVDEDPQPVPETSRYYVTVSDFDDGTSPPADYELRIIARGAATAKQGGTRTVRYDNAGNGFFTTVEPSDLDANTLLAVDRITPSEYPAGLASVRLFNFSGATEGTAKLVVYTDPDGTGNPSNAVKVLERQVTIPAVTANTTFAFNVADANISVASGDIYAGFELTQRPNVHHIPFDLDKLGFRRSFISTDGGRTWGQLVVAFSRGSDIPFIANAFINADLTMGSGTAAAARTQKVTAVRRNGVSRYSGPVKFSVSKLEEHRQR